MKQEHLQQLIALSSGVLFGLGLAVSQMINPAKVLAFLDVAGAWDPSLAFVMASALAVMGIAWRLQGRGLGRSATPALSLDGVDGRLVIGATLFGVGWGAVGYCPGPAIASLALFSAKPLVFVLAMLAGMEIHRRWAGAPGLSKDSRGARDSA